MAPFSIEAVVFGRNDDYEPDWAAKLYASIAHNRRLFEGSCVDFRVAFVEWNPPPERPLLAPTLVEKFPFVRVIVVDSAVHAALCESPDLQVMTNYPFNVGLRTSSADFTLITCGDEFYGTSLAERIVSGGLRAGCLYRAERVNVRADIDFATATTNVLEDPQNLVSVDTCSEPPYDQPPYTNASGDFMLLDAGTMAGIRGMDESIRSARLHTDSRLATNALIATGECELLGRIYHINHSQTYRTNVTNYPGRLYKWDIGLPYLNPSEWGLSGFDWQDVGERVQRISLPAGTPAKPNRFEHPSAAVRERTKLVAMQLARFRAEQQPEEPLSQVDTEMNQLDVSQLFAESHWESSVDRKGDAVSLRTGPVQWSYAAALPIETALLGDRWYWMILDIAVQHGAIGVGFRVEGEFVAERFVGEGTRTKIAAPVPLGADMAILRNIDATGVGTSAVIRSALLASQEKSRIVEV